MLYPTVKFGRKIDDRTQFFGSNEFLRALNANNFNFNSTLVLDAFNPKDLTPLVFWSLGLWS